MNKLLKTSTKGWSGLSKKLPFKPKGMLITSGVINMRNLLRPLLSTLIVLSVSTTVFAATPITLENQSETKIENNTEVKSDVKAEIKVEAKKVEKIVKKKVVQKGRFETLPNGQKVKVFPGKQITEMPKEIGVQYVTEDGYKKLLKELQEAKTAVKPSVPVAPVKIETVILPSEKTDTPADQSVVPQSSQAIVNPVTPITLEPEPVVIQDPIIEVKPVDISILPPASTPVKAQEVADPLPMIQQHPAPVVQSPVPAEVPATPIVVAPVENKAQESQVTENTSVPKVTISVEQRAEMKKQLTEEFSKISIEDANSNLSQKVLEEQQKIEDSIQAKTKAEAEEKAKVEAEEKAVQAAKDEKEYRENAPLAEDNNATPAKAYTEEELKPIRLDKKNKNIVIELPKQRLNAYLTGAPMPKVENLEQQQLDEQRRGLRLEENSDVEEVEGPNYNNN